MQIATPLALALCLGSSACAAEPLPPSTPAVSAPTPPPSDLPAPTIAVNYRGVPASQVFDYLTHTMGAVDVHLLTDAQRAHRVDLSVTTSNPDDILDALAKAIGATWARENGVAVFRPGSPAIP